MVARVGCYLLCYFFFCNDTATTEIYTYGHTLSLHDALPILLRRCDRHSLDLYESSVGPDAPTRQQVGVMLVIHQLKEPTQVQISQRSGIDRSTISGIVRRLAKKDRKSVV